MDRPVPADCGVSGLLAGRLAASLPSGWLQLCGCALGEAGRRTIRVDCVLAHPAIGVALVDIAPPAGPAAPPDDDDAARSLLRRRLAGTGFDAGGPFAGVLPVVRVRLPPDGPHGLITALHDAFRREPALSVPGGYAWVGALRRALEPACEGAHGPIGVGSAPPAAEAATQHDASQPRATPRGTGAAVALAAATFALGLVVGSGLGTGWLAPPERIALGPGSEDAAAPAAAMVAVGSASSAWAGEGLAPPAGGQQTAAVPAAAVEDGRDATPPGNGTPAAVAAATAVGVPEGLAADTRAGRAPPERPREQGAPHDGRAASARLAVQAAPGEPRSVGRAPTIEPRCREMFYRYQLGEDLSRAEIAYLRSGCRG
jgi:hypothetical protein